MLKKLIVLILLFPALSLAAPAPENIMAKHCLDAYQTKYKKLKKHKAFVYAREEETGKDRCQWHHGSKDVDTAKKEALKSCAKHQLNAECFVVDADDEYIVKEGNYSLITPADKTPLSKEQKAALMAEAKTLILGNCLAFYETFLKDIEHRVFTYSLDADGKYACGKSFGGNLQTVKQSALTACKRNKAKRGKNAPKSDCKVYSTNKEILLSASDFGINITPKSDKYLSSEEYTRYLNQAREIVNEGPCLFQFKYYLRGSQHQAFYLANDKQGKQACGRAEGAFSPELANEEALKKCQANVKKKKLKASCKLYAKNFEIVGKPEDFGIVMGVEDYKKAIFKGNLVKIKQYVETGSDVNLTAKDGMSPIFIAAAKGDEDFFLMLVDKGANLQHKANDESNLLLAATLGENPNIIRFLLGKGLDINAKGAEGNTPLHAAFKVYNKYLIGLLMQEGADASIKNDDGKTGNDLAKKMKVNLDNLKTLDINRIDDGCTPVFDAAKYGDVIGIQKLAALKADMNVVCKYGMSSLSIAKNNERFIKELLKLGADVNAQDEDDETPLMNAASHGMKDALSKSKLLLSLGADKSIKDKTGKTAYQRIKDKKTASDELKELLK
ncbi:ankyrin repeat domain-containing protein [uncultured Cocleimonas sp.]|uniref:ankyrin repeat domain-containing protein n=1 Tax=uncultured Cocleimonas sp. TaxID=1051587 RepID=UPI00262F81B0|nr:ankyrin repeat domain-containing protein [uncultured Cocleimonas sp.]